MSFAYPGTTRHVLDRFNFTLRPGERVALIGENGQGKTTIVKLITRLYDPTEGRILLDGVDLRDYDLADLHAEIGVIFQDFMRYEMTARENIAVGRVELEHAMEEIDYAAEKSLASEVVAKLPARLRSDARAALRRRRRSLRRRMAKVRLGARLPARCAAAHSR